MKFKIRDFQIPVKSLITEMLCLTDSQKVNMILAGYLKQSMILFRQ